MTDPADRPDENEEVNEVEATDPGEQRADDLLLAELKQALDRAHHRHADQLISDAQEAFSFLTVQDEFAALVFDSLWEDKLEAMSRALDSIRTLAFESTGLSVEVEISEDGIVGQVSPPDRATVEAERGDGRRTVVQTDEFGSFSLAFPGSGPMRFHLSRGELRTVTDWFNSAA